MSDTPTADADTSPEGSIREILEAVFRRQKLVLAFFLAVVGATLLVVAAAPDAYTSTAKIMVRRGRESAVLDPTAATGEVLPLYKEWENEINSEVEILTSHELAGQTVAAIGADRILTAPAVEPRGWLAPLKRGIRAARALSRGAVARVRGWTRSAGETETQKQNGWDKAARIVEKNLEIQSQRKSDVITISYTAAHPALAQEVVSALIRLYQEKRLQIHSTPGSRKFFQEQTASIKRELARAENELRRQKDALGVVSLEGRRESLVERLNGLQNQKLGAEAGLSAARAKVDALKEMVAQESGRASARGAIVRGDYKDIQAAQRIEETAMASLSAQVAMLERQMTDTQQEIARLNQHEAAIVDLQRKADLLEAKFRKYSESLEQTRIDQALEAEKVSNISMVQAATRPSEPNPSRKALKLLFAAVLGLFGGAGLALGLDRMGSTVRHPDEAGRRLQLTPLASIPLLDGAQLHPLRLACAPGAGDSGLLRRIRDGFDSKWDVDSHFTRLLRRILSIRSLQGSNPLVLGVTSCYGREGVTLIAAQLAVTFARMNPQAKVLFLDSNRHAHSAEQEDWLTLGRGGLEVRADADGQAAFLARHLEGQADKNGHAGTAIERVSRHRISPLLHRAAAQGFEVVVVDIPPLSEGSDAEQIASMMSAVVLVLEAERVRWQTVQWAKTLLSDTGTQLLGIVLNKQKSHVPSWLQRRL